ncbi:MAG TPA: SRPBCC domain-containing protein [Bryobacteraceae bacterium]
MTLVVRRTIRASQQRLFDAWTQPELLLKWWGPRPVRCVGAEIDLRTGGAYRIDNEFPDGTILSIRGTFEVVEPPRRLIYSWRAGEEAQSLERVTVQFEATDAGMTEVIVTHERIPGRTLLERHKMGWEGCLDGLAAYIGDIFEPC